MGRLFVICAGFVLAISMGLFGQALTIPAKVTVAPGDLATVKIQWDGSDIKYVASPGLNVLREYDPDPKVIALRAYSKNPGEYTITAVVASPAGKLSDFHVCTVIVSNTGPQPPPGPVTPKASCCWVVVLENAEVQRDPATARVLTDRTLWADLEKWGNKWSVAQNNDPKVASYLPSINAIGYPALILADSEGKFISARKLPGTADEIRNLVKESCGK